MENLVREMDDEVEDDEVAQVQVINVKTYLKMQ
jgi:hypothetical protein